MNLIYVGSSCPKDYLEKLIKMGSKVDYAGNTLQEALLEGFLEHDKNLKVITSWIISTYPKITKKILPSIDLPLNGKFGNYKYVGGLNLPVLNLLSRFWRTRKALKEYLSKNEENYVVIYEVHTPFLLAVASLRKRIQKTCLIVPDLPQFMSGNTGFIHGILKKIDSKLINWSLKRIDSYALLSEPMLEKIPVGDKPWVLMEGIYSSKEDGTFSQKEEYKTIMYTGNIYRRRGIDILLDAFEKIDNPNYRLWIRGEGEMKEEIIAKSKIDKRITYFPPLSMHELRNLERRATVMVNSTPPSDFTNYFFPSKTMEYLASGTPTIMFKLGCMPKEYEPYLYYVDGDSMEDLKNKLIEVCEKPKSELYEFGNKARLFVLEKKNPYSQCGNIVNLLKSL